MDKSYIKEMMKANCSKLIETVKSYDTYIRENSLLNEQWFLDFQDELNAISVK